MKYTSTDFDKKTSSRGCTSFLAPTFHLLFKIQQLTVFFLSNAKNAGKFVTQNSSGSLLKNENKVVALLLYFAYQKLRRRRDLDRAQHC